ncbi:hypothetical protein [Streptomyces sp. NPDC046870]|uniref:hypothetical protein n=1 Tax=Streptomyces sp. NPDC046870 TaxID=3155135 RepID=UPI003451DE7F
MSAEPLFTIRSGRPTEHEIAVLTVALLTCLHRSAADPAAVAGPAHHIRPDAPVVAGWADWPCSHQPAATGWGHRSDPESPAAAGWPEWPDL